MQMPSRKEGLVNPMIRTVKNFGALTPKGTYNTLGLVIDGCTDNGKFPALPVPVPDMTTLHTRLGAAILDAQVGGPEARARRQNVVAEANTALQKNASYVDIQSDNDLAVLLSSGFKAVSTNRVQSPLSQPEIFAVEYGDAGQLRPRIRTQANVKSYVGRIKEANGSEYGPSISFASSRAILFSGLKAGVTYVMQLCAIGGSNGQSDWTEPVSKMAM